MDNCIFCKTIANQVPSYVVDENEYAIAILPKDMECFGHTLIIPKKHFESIFDIDDENTKEFMLFTKNLALKYRDKLWATGVNLLNASGKDAQQSVPHLHFHLIPRFPDDKMDTWPRFEKFDWNHETDLQKIRNKIF